MKGLLHRVAARAAGTAVAVRSDAGLPYAGSGAGLRDVGEAEAHFPTVVAPRSQMPSASTAHEPERAARAPDSADRMPDANAARATPPRVDAATDAAAVRDTPTIVPNAMLAPRVEPTQPSAFDEPGLTMPPVRVAPPMPGVAPTAIEPGAEAAHAPRLVAIAARNATEPDEPAPLMPREARPTPLAPVPQPATRRGTSPQSIAAAQSEADTEVHIHIGRIDVTAVHETPAPRRRAAAAPAPMSLDGYLAQRGRS